MTNDFKSKKKEGFQRLSKEAYAEAKKVEKQEIYERIDRITMEVANHPDKLKQYLDTQSNMDRYSVVNALLISEQRPKAKKIKTFGEWGEDGIAIKKGEKSIQILEPVEYTKADGSDGISYNIKKVFDIEQTTEKKSEEKRSYDMKQVMISMLDIVPVEIQSVQEIPIIQALAYYNDQKETLYVRRDAGTPEEIIKSIAVELGHAQMAMGMKPYKRQEFQEEARCIGYMLCRKYGVEGVELSLQKMQSKWQGMEPKVVRGDLSRIKNVMSELQGKINSELYARLQKQKKNRDVER